MPLNGRTKPGWSCRQWLALAGILALALLAFAGLRTPHDAASETATPPADAPAPIEASSRPIPTTTRPGALRRLAPVSVPLEDSSSGSVNLRHRQAMLALARVRQDAVDDCRDRVKLPPVAKLLPWSTPVGPPGSFEQPVQEISMEQTIVFDVATSAGAWHLVAATVIETWLSFPASDGSLRRSPFSDPSLDRCVEGALAGAVVRSPGVAAGERFLIQGHAGEAVYDLR